MTLSSFTESFLLFFIWGYFFLHILKTFPKCPSSDSTEAVISKCSIQKNGLSLWNECIHHKAVAQKASLRFSSEDVSLLTAGLRALLNITLQISQRQNFQTGQCRVSFNSVKWVYISESSFFWTLLSGFHLRIFHVSLKSSMHSKISHFRFYRNSVQTLP